MPSDAYSIKLTASLDLPDFTEYLFNIHRPQSSTRLGCRRNCPCTQEACVNLQRQAVHTESEELISALWHSSGKGFLLLVLRFWGLTSQDSDLLCLRWVLGDEERPASDDII